MKRKKSKRSSVRWTVSSTRTSESSTTTTARFASRETEEGGRGNGGEGERGEGEGRGAPGIRRRQLRRELSWSSDDLRRGKRRHVNSLVQQFEKNDGMVSPSPVATTGGGLSRHRLPDSPLRDDSTPLIPPRPRRPPPRPPPWGSSSDKPPAVPPHTPAPLIPPKPSSRKV